MKQEDELRQEIRWCDAVVGWLSDEGLNEQDRYLTAYGMALRFAAGDDIENPVDVLVEQIKDIEEERGGESAFGSYERE